MAYMQSLGVVLRVVWERLFAWGVVGTWGIPKDQHSSKPSDCVFGVVDIRGVVEGEAVGAGLEEVGVDVADFGSEVEGGVEEEDVQVEREFVAVAVEWFGLEWEMKSGT